MQTPEEFVKSNDPDKILTFDEIDDRIKLIRARDAEWQARVDRLEAALEECIEYIQRADRVNPMEALYRGEGYSRDALPLINKICAALGRET